MAATIKMQAKATGTECYLADLIRWIAVVTVISPVKVVQKANVAILQKTARDKSATAKDDAAGSSLKCIRQPCRNSIRTGRRLEEV